MIGVYVRVSVLGTLWHLCNIDSDVGSTVVV